MKLIIYISIFIISSLKVAGQNYSGIVNKKAENLYNQALNKAGDGQYAEAIKIIADVLKLEPKYLDAYLTLGGIYGELKQYKNSVNNYEKAKAIDSIYFKDYALPYSINLAGLGEFEKALSAVNNKYAYVND